MSTLSIFDPLRDFSDRFLNQPLLGRGMGNWQPAIDVRETDKEYIIKADIPGVKKEDINLELNNGILTLSGERKEEKKEETEKSQRVERFYGKFIRTIQVPQGITEKDIKATYNDGVLDVHFPRLQDTNKKIMIGGGKEAM